MESNGESAEPDKSARVFYGSAGGLILSLVTVCNWCGWVEIPKSAVVIFGMLGAGLLSYGINKTLCEWVLRLIFLLYLIFVIIIVVALLSGTGK